MCENDKDATEDESEKEMEALMESQLQMDWERLMYPSDFLNISCSSWQTSFEEQMTKRKTIVLKIVNICSYAKLQSRINIEDLAVKLRNCKRDKNGKFGISLSLNNPEATVRVFQSGKLSCMGTCSEQESKKAMLAAVRKISNYIPDLCGKPAEKIISNYRISNMVACYKSGSKIRMDDFANYMQGMEGTTEFDPEKYPSIRVKNHFPWNRSIFFGVHANGKVNITGAKSREEIRTAFRDTIYPLLTKFSNPMPENPLSVDD